MARRPWVLAAISLVHGALIAAAWTARLASPQSQQPVWITLQASVASSSPASHEPQVPVPVATIAESYGQDMQVEQPPALRLPPDGPVVVPSAMVSAEIEQPPPPEGGDYEVDLNALCAERPPPSYPRESKRRHEQGEVLLLIEIDESGHVERVAIANSSGYARLDEAARMSVESWRCRPMQRGGHAVPAVALQSFDFVLRHR